MNIFKTMLFAVAMIVAVRVHAMEQFVKNVTTETVRELFQRANNSSSPTSSPTTPSQVNPRVDLAMIGTVLGLGVCFLCLFAYKQHLYEKRSDEGYDDHHQGVVATSQYEVIPGSPSRYSRRQSRSLTVNGDCD